jgi:HemY protein
MKRILFFLLAIALLICIGIELRLHPSLYSSSIAIMLPNNVVHIETWFALLAIFLGYIVLHYVWLLIKFTGSLPRRWRAKKAQQRLTNSIMMLASGDHTHAQELALDHINAASNPLLHYLVAAYAAQQQRQTEKRDQYLQSAYDLMPEAKIPLGLLRAQWQIEAKQYDSALETLLQLREQKNEPKRVLQLLTETYLHLHRWHDISDLQPLLAKHRVFSTSRYLNIMRIVHEHALTSRGDAKLIESSWNNMPKQLQSDLQMIYLYALALLRNKQFAQAEKLLERTLKNQWNWALVRLYGNIDIGNAAAQFELAESWLKAHQKDPDLYYTLARLAGRNNQWDQCYSYYRQSLLLRPDAEVYASYAQALENNGNQQESFVNYRRGLLQYLQQNKLDRDTRVTLSE